MSYIILSDYFGPWVDHPDVSDEIVDNAERLLEMVNAVLELAYENGVDMHINPSTGTYVAGQTLGGFRPRDAKTGAKTSSHKEGRGVDIYDPSNELDDWCFKHQDVLRRFGIYIEDPVATPRWCHMTDRPPRSGKTVFMP